MGETDNVQLIHPSRIPNRWVQLVAGIIAMMAIANLQYAWTLFAKPIQSHLFDRIGPRLMLGIQVALREPLVGAA